MDNKKGLNTNANGYILLYSVIVVVVAAFLLAFVYQILKPQSDANVEMDKKSQILACLNIRNIEKDKIADTYSNTIECDEIIDSDANIIKDGKQKDKNAFLLDSKDINEKSLPLYVCSVNGETKYIIPLFGKGLWGPIWGYISLNEDKKTVYGAYFNHESETAGLGAKIVEEDFQNQFCGKKVEDNLGQYICVVKHGKVTNKLIECDGISGATKTSIGVSNMLKDCLNSYKTFINK